HSPPHPYRTPAEPLTVRGGIVKQPAAKPIGRILDSTPATAVRGKVTPGATASPDTAVIFRGARALVAGRAQLTLAIASTGKHSDRDGHCEERNARRSKSPSGLCATLVGDGVAALAMTLLVRLR